MAANPTQGHIPETQAAIYRAALSLDGFLVNAIQFGVLHPGYFDGLVERAGANLQMDLAILEDHAAQAPEPARRRASETVATLRARCRELTELVMGLLSFRTLSREQLRSVVSQIPALRDACVHQIQELERCFQVPRPFYQLRPAQSAAAVTELLAGLENLLHQEAGAPDQ